MANIERGEADIVVGGKTYTLVLDLNACCEFEAVIGTPAHPVSLNLGVQRALELHMTYWRALVWAALRKHHKEISLVEGVNALIEDAGGVFTGGVKRFMQQITALMPTLHPDADDEAVLRSSDGDGDASPRPIEAVPPTTAGTGRSSTVRRVKSA